jgi:hypothetical protein
MRIRGELTVTRAVAAQNAGTIAPRLVELVVTRAAARTMRILAESALTCTAAGRTTSPCGSTDLSS